MAHAAGVPVVLDAGGATDPLPPDLLRCLSVISPNETELQGLTGACDAVVSSWGAAAATASCCCSRAVHLCLLLLLLLCLLPVVQSISAPNPLELTPAAAADAPPRAGMPTDSEEQVVAAAQELRRQGAATVLVKLGSRGSLLVGAWVRLLWLSAHASPPAMLPSSAPCPPQRASLPLHAPLPHRPLQTPRGRCGGSRRGKWSEWWIRQGQVGRERLHPAIRPHGVLSTCLRPAAGLTSPPTPSLAPPPITPAPPNNTRPPRRRLLHCRVCGGAAGGVCLSRSHALCHRRRRALHPAGGCVLAQGGRLLLMLVADWAGSLWPGKAAAALLPSFLRPLISQRSSSSLPPPTQAPCPRCPPAPLWTPRSRAPHEGGAHAAAAAPRMPPLWRVCAC